MLRLSITKASSALPKGELESLPIAKWLFLDAYIASWANRCDRSSLVAGSHLVVVHDRPRGFFPDLDSKLVDSAATGQTPVDNSHDEVVTGNSVNLSEAPELSPRVVDHEIVVIYRVEVE